MTFVNSTWSRVVALVAGSALVLSVVQPSFGPAATRDVAPTTPPRAAPSVEILNPPDGFDWSTGILDERKR